MNKIDYRYINLYENEKFKSIPLYDYEAMNIKRKNNRIFDDTIIIILRNDL